jgi:hypothetical protein
MFALFITMTLLLGSIPDEGLYWVFFTDRGADFEQRLESASINIMNGPSAERRFLSGTLEADQYDLSPSALYVSFVESVCSQAVRTSSRYLNAVSISLTPAEVETLRGEPFVKEVRPVGVSNYSPSNDIPAPDAYGLAQSQLEQINILALHQRGWTGSGVVIGVLDTGFELQHPCLQSISVLDQWDFVNNDSIVAFEDGDPLDQPSHGTKVLSMIAGYQPGLYAGGAFNSSFLLAKTEDTTDEYQQEEDFWVSGLEWLEENGADLVSSSLGYTSWYEPYQMDGNTAVTTIAADIAASRGMVVWNSVGNDGPGDTTIVAPSDGDSVFAVGGVDGGGNVADFSSRGPTADGRIKPDGCARGENAVFASYGGTGYSTGGGTSFAAPLVSSAAACIASAHPNWPVMRIYEALRATADRFSNPDNAYGYGIIDAFEAVKHRSVIGRVQRSDTGESLALQQVSITMESGLPIYTTTNGQGCFAVEPGSFGNFTATATGWGNPLPYQGVLGENGIEITLYVDPIGSSQPPSVYPNPSSGEFFIGFDVVEALSNVSLSIFTISGELIHSEDRGTLQPGCYRAPLPEEAFFWNGSDEDGEPAVSGQYIGMLKVGDSVELLNIALVRGMEED